MHVFFAYLNPHLKRFNKFASFVLSTRRERLLVENIEEIIVELL